MRIVCVRAPETADCAEPEAVVVRESVCMQNETSIHLVDLPDHGILEKRTPIGCDSAKMRPLRTPRADEPEKS